MLRGTYACIGHINERVVAFALIESFCIHARGLIEFFEDRRGARKYTDTAYVPFSGGNKTRRTQLKRKLNNQVAHVMEGRTSDQAQKVGPADQSELLALLDAELLHFRAHLLPEYASVGPLNTSTSALTATVPPASTNHIIIEQSANVRTIPLTGGPWKKN